MYSWIEELAKTKTLKTVTSIDVIYKLHDEATESQKRNKLRLFVHDRKIKKQLSAFEEIKQMELPLRQVTYQGQYRQDVELQTDIKRVYTCIISQGQLEKSFQFCRNQILVLNRVSGLQFLNFENLTNIEVLEIKLKEQTTTGKEWIALRDGLVKIKSESFKSLKVTIKGELGEKHF